MLIILFILGLLSGLFAGLLGIGGGIISVPVLYYLFSWQNLPNAMEVAIATSLAAIFITTLLSTWVHHRKSKGLPFRILGFLVPGLIVGCISGAQLAHLLPGNALRIIFGGMAILIGIYFSVPKFPIPKISERPNPLLTFFGLIIGHLSSLLGIGGGIFTVPLLLAYHLPAQNLIAASSAATLTTSFIGTITYLLMGAHMSTTVNWVAFLAISLGSLCTTAFGVHLAQKLPTPLLKRIFGAVLSFTGAVMLFV